MNGDLVVATEEEIDVLDGKLDAIEEKLDKVLDELAEFRKLAETIVTQVEGFASGGIGALLGGLSDGGGS